MIESGREREPLAGSTAAVRVSVRTGVHLDKTVKAYLDSSDPEKNEEAMYFVRRVKVVSLALAEIPRDLAKQVWREK